MKKIKKNKIFLTLLLFLASAFFSNSLMALYLPNIDYEKITEEKFSKYEIVKKYKFYKDIDFHDNKTNDKEKEYYFEIGDEIESKINSNYSNLVILEENGSEIPYTIWEQEGGKKYGVVYEAYNKLYQKKTKKGVEVLLDFGNKLKSPLEITLRTDNFKNIFAASYKVYGSDLKNSKYKDITISDEGYGIIRKEYEIHNIRLARKNRYVKIVFNLDEGEIGDLVFEKKIKKLKKYYPEMKSKKAKIISEKRDKNIKELILDTEIENLKVDWLEINTTKDEFSPREIVIYGADDKNALDYSSSKRYDKNKTYWKEITRRRIKYDFWKKFFDLDLRKSPFRYYKVIIKGGENDIISEINFKSIKKYVIFKNNEFKNNKLRVYYGGDVKEKKIYNDFLYNSQWKRIIFNDFKDRDLNFKKVWISTERNNNNFLEKKKMSKTESRIFIYLAIFILVLFLAWYLIRIFRDIEEK